MEYKNPQTRKTTNVKKPHISADTLDLISTKRDRIVSNKKFEQLKGNFRIDNGYTNLEL
ncbi:MAG: hypothetical protein QXD23_02335 [Candidatus Micrarchaeaceae archaeon]